MKMLSMVFLFAVSIAGWAQQETRVPFELSKHIPGVFVEVRVNGAVRQFLLDTGASKTIVDRSVLGFRPGQLTEANFQRNGGMTGESIVAVVQLGFGKRFDPAHEVQIMDLKKASEVYGRPVDGLLGLDVLRTCNSITFDFKRRTLDVSW